MSAKITAETWALLQAKLDLLLALDSEQRMKQLSALEVSDPDLAQTVRELLESQDRMPDSLPAEAVAQAFASAELGSAVGAFVLDAPIGQGGSSDVFRAHRASDFSQTVAIKMLRSVSSDQFEVRFRRERDILAQLNHPNIARLYDAGTTSDGRSYLVLEYVEGTGLLEWVRRTERTLDEVIAVLIKVCEAVDYAHRRLLVHRDLKPANILIDANGEPKLLDFGVAKLLDPDLANGLTQDALAPLTPAYAAPEQVNGGAITTATDIYALGVILFEALCGRHPYRQIGDTAAQLLHKITTEEVARPSHAHNPLGVALTHRAFLTRKSDFDHVILCAMEKQPDARYGSAQLLADDLRAALAGEPIRARARTWRYVVNRLVARHRVGVSFGAVAGVALLVAIGIALWQGQVAERERGRAEKRFAEVRQLANRLLFSYYDGIKPLQGSLPVQRQLVQDGLNYLESLRAETSSDGALLREVGDAYARIGDIQGNFTEANAGDLAGAAKSYAAARAAYSNAVLAGGRSLEVSKAAAALLVKEAHLAYQRANVTEAKAHYEAAISAWREIVGTAADGATAKLNLASALDAYGDLIGRDGTIGIADPKAAVGYYAEARALREGLVRESPTLPGLQVAIYESELRDGESAWAQGNKTDAVSLFEKALARARAIAAGEPDSSYRQREVALVLTRLAPTYEAVEQLDASVTAAVDAATIMQRLFAADPTNEAMRSGAMMTAGWAARQLLKTPRFEEAAQFIEAEMKFARERLVASPDDAESQASVALAHRRAGMLAYRRGLFAEAKTEHEKARALQVKFRHNAPESRMAAALSLSHIGRAELGAARIVSARDSIARALTEMRAVVAEKPTTRFKDDLIDALDLQSAAFMATPQDRRRANMALSEALQLIDAEAKRRTLASSELRRRDAIIAKLARQ